MAQNDRLDDIIKSIDRLPPLPDVATRILDMSGDPDVDFKDIIEVIQFDQAITANCLRLCNSSYFGLRVKVFSLEQAVVMLGIQNIVMIVLANCSGLSPYSKAQEGYNLNPGELWRHSITCAILSQLLIEKANLQKDSTLFTAALLHDVGKLVLDKFIVEAYDHMLERIQGEGMSFIEAEKEVFGVDHAEVGGLIAESWNFPEALVKSIKGHHRPLSGEIIPNVESWVRLTNLVYYVSLVHLFCSYHRGIQCQVDRSILLQFGLKPKQIGEIMAALPAEMKKAESLLNIPL